DSSLRVGSAFSAAAEARFCRTDCQNGRGTRASRAPRSRRFTNMALPAAQQGEQPPTCEKPAWNGHFRGCDQIAAKRRKALIAASVIAGARSIPPALLSAIFHCAAIV